MTDFAVQAGLQEVMWSTRITMMLRWLDRRPDVLRVLLYHRVAHPYDLGAGDPNLLSATPAMFNTQMNYLARHYNPIKGQVLLDAIQQRTRLPERAVLVTFDDGYRDFLTDAWPVLRRYEIPATMFVPTAFPDSGRAFWWDDLHYLLMRTDRRSVTFPQWTTLELSSDHHRSMAVRRLNRMLRRKRPEVIDAILERLGEMCNLPRPEPVPLLSWDELRQLAGSGLTVASHTRTHLASPALTEEEIAAEISGSQDDLRREVGEAVPLFSYPHGIADRRVDAVLRANGVLAAFTDAPGRNLIGGAALFNLRRRAINESRSFADFSLSLISVYSRLQELSTNGGRFNQF